MNKKFEDKSKDLENNNIKENRKINITFKKVLVLVILFLICFYTLNIIYKLVIEPTNIFTIENGSLCNQETSTGYVIREEIVVQGDNYKNGVEPIKLEGEKASKNENIFRYYSKNEEKLKIKIQELDIKIQEAMLNEKSIYSPDMKQLEEKIDEKIDKIVYLTDSSYIDELKNEIDDLIIKKAKIAGDLSPGGTYLNTLIEERKGYESQLNSGCEYVTASISGVVSYKVDGYEEILTPSNLSSLSLEYLEDLKLTTGQIIVSNNEKGKVIDNFKYYIATSSKTLEAQNAEINDKITIRLSNGDEIYAKIVHKNKEEDDRVLLVLELEEGIEELIDYRKIIFDLIWWKDTGLKIPNEAIVQENDLNYVVRNRAGYLSKLLVKVERKGEKYSIVEPYSNEELEKMGYVPSEIINYKKVTIYDEILLKPNLSNLK